jgi:predicted CoA-binding protein
MEINTLFGLPYEEILKHSTGLTMDPIRENNKPTAVLGASPKPERYSNKALRMLANHGHTAIPVNPAHPVIDGLVGVRSLSDLSADIHTITIYLSPDTGAKLAEEIIAKAPQRVIINPGAESPELERKLREAGIQFEHACTLVLLQTGQY